MVFPSPAGMACLAKVEYLKVGSRLITFSGLGMAGSSTNVLPRLART
jgi:hypothetical protein